MRKKKPCNGDKLYYYSTKYECAKEIYFNENDTYSLLNWKVGNLFKRKDKASDEGQTIMNKIRKEYNAED